jgi:hypothetical protein
MREVPHLVHYRRIDFLNASLDKLLMYPNGPVSSLDLASDLTAHSYFVRAMRALLRHRARH